MDTLVIIGGDAAGMSAASKVRRVHKDKKIIVFEKSAYTSYSACGIPYFISGLIESIDELVRRSPDEFRNKYNIDVHTEHLVLEVDTNGKRIRVLDKQNNTEFWQPYGQLLIATGGKAYCPKDITGYDAENVFGVTTLKSGINIENFIEDKKPQTAVIVGGGYIGLEMAESLLRRGLEVTLITKGAQVMNTLDPDMGVLVTEALQVLGVTVYLNESLKGFVLEGNTITEVITDKQNLPADMVVFGMGTSPNTAFLEGSGIELGVKGAIKVNAQMQTNIPDVWAAGDCTETLNMVSRQHIHIALGTLANKTGLVAGSSIAGEQAVFPGAVGTAVCKICSYEVARTGLQEKELNKLGIEYAATTVDSLTRANYYPGATKIVVKLLAEKNSGRLLGGQIIGQEGAAKRIDVLATAITHNLTLQNIIDLDLSYAPPFSPVWDPVQTCARKLIKMI
ncbi:flavoprotein oxidoreductase [Flavobacterium akiainvivens]|uniref:Flavoprotein oxidoreductase n=1 Tax=Flavobacterium akiainvivens TaxID=1202724 RepID=A0A0M8M7J6_9FLAO|nr:FAD-dependent oxidoreductase [Flavobacterium akiainvivens]KOS05033.1 flavoprotein oxidoreductase [Flavobacterium akiainvivens]SFQ39954.1 NADPH-dependent 2,4-dienoyl-CoA reductase, sulfur reductase [Flavobacterium akiainvivens]